MNFLKNALMAAAGLSLALPAVAADHRMRDYLNQLPADHAFEFNTPTARMDVRLHFVPVESVAHDPAFSLYTDPFTGRAQVEFFDHLPLRSESTLVIGEQRFPLSCVRFHGGGMDDDSTPLQFVKIFFPTDDPDGQCIGPLNPNYPAEGEKKLRWGRYLVVSWDLENNRMIDADLVVAGVTYDLK